MASNQYIESDFVINTHGRHIASQFVEEGGIAKMGISLFSNTDSISFPKANFDFRPTSNDFTISFWLKTSDPYNGGIILSKATCAAASCLTAPDVRQIWIAIAPASLGEGKLLVTMGGDDHTYGFKTNTAIATTTSLDDDLWHHAAIVNDSNTNRFYIYIDGSISSLVDTAGASISYGTSGTATATTDMVFAGSSDGSDSAFPPLTSYPPSGIYDQLTFWNSSTGDGGAFTASQITELYNSGKIMDPTTHSNSSKLHSWFKFGEGDDTNTNGIKDSGGSNYHGTANNLDSTRMVRYSVRNAGTNRGVVCPRAPGIGEVPSNIPFSIGASAKVVPCLGFRNKPYILSKGGDPSNMG